MFSICVCSIFLAKLMEDKHIYICLWWVCVLTLVLPRGSKFTWVNLASVNEKKYLTLEINRLYLLLELFYYWCLHVQNAHCIFIHNTYIYCLDYRNDNTCVKYSWDIFLAQEINHIIMSSRPVSKICFPEDYFDSQLKLENIAMIFLQYFACW